MDEGFLTSLLRQRQALAGHCRYADLLAVPCTVDARVHSVFVHRNHGFEAVAAIRQPFLNAWKARFEMDFGPYDDSLSFAGWREADLHLVWLDLQRYQTDDGDLADWLRARLNDLRARTTRPVLVVLAGREEAAERVLRRLGELPSVHGISLDRRFRSEGSEELYDARSLALTGSRVSRNGAIFCARLVFAQLSPPLLGWSLRAIAVDMDQTLHSGVLGEDGAHNVTVEAGHRRLQEHLKAKAAEGVLLALVTHNDPEDVARALGSGAGYALGLNDFTHVFAGWEPKSVYLERWLTEIRVAPETVLFVDDNPGQMAEVAARLPGMSLLLADDQGDLTARALPSVPGFFTWTQTNEDRLRAADLTANAPRQTLRDSAATEDDYLRALGIRTTFIVDQPALTTRLAQLSIKTNQFNLTFARMTERDVAAFVEAPDAMMIAVGMCDTLSDSGVICALALRFQDGTLLIHDLALSCRALGRGAETDIIFGALSVALARHRVERITLLYRPGPRNEPAARWLLNTFGVTAPVAPTELDLPVERIRAHTFSPHIARTVGDA